MTKANPLSFLPDDYLLRKAQLRSNVFCGTLAAIVILAIGSAFTVTDRMNRNAEHENTRVRAEFTDATRLITQVDRMQDKQHRLVHEADLAQSLLEKIPRSYILAAITNALPANVSLLDFSLESKRHLTAQPSAADKTQHNAKPSPAVAEPIVYDVQMKLTGVADNDVEVSEFIGRLEKSPIFRDVNLNVSDEYTLGPQKLRRFQLDMTLDPDAKAPSQPRSMQ